MKKRIIIVLLISVITIAIISLYRTFAFNEESNSLEKSLADHNLIYSLKEQSNKEIILLANEEKFIDITLNNPYDSTVRYGMYYYLITPNEIPSGFTISLADESSSPLEDIIKSNESKVITIKIKNDSSYQVELLVGALVGFENGNITDLVQNGEVLIK